MSRTDTQLLEEIGNGAPDGAEISEPASRVCWVASVRGYDGPRLTLVQPVGRTRSIEMRIATCESRIQSIDDRCNANMTRSSEAVDRATELSEWAIEMAARQAFESGLRQARHALDRAKQGKGDVCEACGARIEQARLDAVPGTTMCVECQWRRERHPS